MPPTVRCPSCGGSLPPGARSCPVCELSLVGPAAAELWEVDQQLAALRRRRTVLLAALQTPPQPVDGAPAGGPRSARPGAIRAWPAQQVLLAVGALLVVVAASVFLAVAWDVLGVGGQVAVMALLTLVAGGSSAVLGRRGLRASAEALAVLAVALALVDAAAARWLDLAGLGAVDGWGYAAWVAAGLALVMVAVSPPVLARTATTYRLVAVLAATVAPLLGLVAAEPSGLAATLVCALLAALAGWGSRRLPHGWDFYRRPLVPVFGGYLVLTWLLAPAVAVDGPLLDEGAPTHLVALAAAGGAAWAAGLHRGLRSAASLHPVLAGAALLGGALQVVALAAEGGLAWVVVLTVAAAVVPALAAGTTSALATTRGGVAAATAQLVVVGALLVCVVLVPAAGDTGWVALAAALAGACCGSAVLAARRPRLRAGAGGWAAATGAAAVAAATVPLGSPANAYAVAATAAALVGVCAALRSRLELVVGGVAVGTALVAVALAAVAGPGSAAPPPLALVLAVLGVVALAYGIRPQRGRVAWIGVLLCSAGNAVAMSSREISLVEAYSLPLAALALGVGLVRLRRQPTTPSWLTVGPAVTAGLLPSAFATVGDPSLTRPAVVLAVAAAVMLAGITLRWQAPFLSGALAACVVAIAQLAPYAVGVPRWVTFGAVGLVLLVLGSRYEQRRRNAAHAVHWVAALR